MQYFMEDMSKGFMDTRPGLWTTSGEDPGLVCMLHKPT